MKETLDSTYNNPSILDSVLDKHWGNLSSIIDRAVLLNNLGIDGRNENILGGMTMFQIVQSKQHELPCEVRDRLIMAITNDGFSVSEYQRVLSLNRNRKQ